MINKIITLNYNEKWGKFLFCIIIKILLFVYLKGIEIIYDLQICFSFIEFIGSIWDKLCIIGVKNAHSTPIQSSIAENTDITTSLLYHGRTKRVKWWCYRGVKECIIVLIIGVALRVSYVVLNGTLVPCTPLLICAEQDESVLYLCII